MLEKFLRACA